MLHKHNKYKDIDINAPSSTEAKILERDFKNFRLANMNTFRATSDDYAAADGYMEGLSRKELRKRYWIASFGGFIYYLPICFIAGWNINTLYWVNVIAMGLNTFTDALMHRIGWMFVVMPPVIMDIVMLGIKWIHNPPTLLNGSIFIICGCLINYLTRTVAFQLPALDRAGWIWLYTFVGISLPNQYLTIGGIIMLIVYIIAMIIVLVFLQPRFQRHKLRKNPECPIPEQGIPVYVPIAIIFYIACYIGKHYIPWI